MLDIKLLEEKMKEMKCENEDDKRRYARLSVRMGEILHVLRTSSRVSTAEGVVITMKSSQYHKLCKALEASDA